MVISDLHSGRLSSSVGRSLITTSETELQGCNSFSLLLIQEVDSSLASLGLMTALCLSGASTVARAGSSLAREAFPMLPSQQIASGLATLQCLPVNYCIDFRAFFLPRGRGP